jgi:alpha-1,6-mannosyltransferase
VRVVDVSGFYAPRGGGVRSYVEAKLAYADASGDEVIVVAPGAEDRWEPRAGGAIRWVAAPRFPFDRRYRMLVHADPVHRLLDDLRPDLVEASSPWRTAAIVASWRGEAPRHWVMHADPLAAYAYRWFDRVASQRAIDAGFGWYWRYMRRLAPTYSSVVCPNHWLATRLADGGVPHARSIPFGVESNLFSPALRDEALRRDLLDACGCPQDGLLLLGVGRHSPEKNWPLAIEAARAAGARRDVALVLVGEGRDTPAIVQAAAGSPHVRLLAPTADRRALARLMASADALIHACAAETFCFVAAEAAASGLPVLTPDKGGAGDAAGEAARPYRAGDAASAAAAIARLPDRRGSPPPLRQQRKRLMTDHFAELFESYRTSLRWAA